jgi:DNA-binding transcriptional LysR family regulator
MAEFDTLQIRKVDGGLLLIFRELLLRRRASAVAGQLGLSPSAISHALTRLRDAFGDPLFIRRSHGLEPTQRALELGPQIEQLIKLLGAAVGGDNGFDAGESHRRFRIVCPDHIASMLGGPLAAAFGREAPSATFSVRPAFLSRALRAVRRDEADVAIGIFEQIPRGLDACALYEDRYCVIARVGHPTVQGAVDWPTYASIGHVFCGIPDGLLSDDAAYYDRKAMSATYGDNPGPEMIRTQAYFAQWESVMLLVAESDLLADCPRRLAERFAARLGLQIIEPPYPLFPMPVQAVRRADAPDAGVDWLMEKIAAVLV